MIYGERFEEALKYAARLHRAQVRKGTNTPYVTHLLAVAAIVGENGGTEDEAIAALLHDAVEDQGGAPTREEIRRRFGDAVAGIVDEVSDTDVVPKPPWRERKEAYVKHVRDAQRSARLVSAADSCIMHAPSWRTCVRRATRRGGASRPARRTRSGTTGRSWTPSGPPADRTRSSTSSNVWSTR